MTSFSFPHPTDADLLAWLDGDNSRAAHIAHCPECRARARALQDENLLLRASMYRAECPAAHELGEYGLGLLPQTRLDEIARHVAHCPHCRQELAIQQKFLTSLATETAPAAKSTLGEQVRIVIATLIQDLRNGWQGMGAMQPAMAAMRGKQNKPLIYEAENYQLTIEIQEDPKNRGRQALYGLLVGDDDPTSFEIQLWQGPNLIAQTDVDEYGNFSIANLMKESYDLKLIKPELEIRLEALQL